MSWSTLHPEIHCMIFSYLTSDKCRQYVPPITHQSRRKRRTGFKRGEQSQYAAVNRDWQAYFEHKNFRRLIIHQSDILQFGHFVVGAGRGDLVEWVWLRLELPQYCCDKCGKPESEFEKQEHEATLTEALRGLLHLISNFSAYHPGITLELSAHSPSDYQHWFKNLSQTKDDTMWYSSGTDLVNNFVGDRSHDYRYATRRPLTSYPYLRAFGDPSGLIIDPARAGIAPRRTLPKANAVKELIIRLQFQKHFSIKKGLLPIVRSLPSLESLTYECRRGSHFGFCEEYRKIRDSEHCGLFSHVVASCQSLRNVSIHEADCHAFSPVGALWTPCADIGRSFGEHSGRLQELHVSGMIEAKDFFYQFCLDGTDTPTPKKGKRKRGSPRKTKWPRLEHLSLTTNLLCTTSRQVLLQAAAAAVERMPKLKTMELSGSEGNEKFIYLIQGPQHIIIMPSGMVSGLSMDTIHCWKDLATRDQNLYDLRIEVLPDGADDDDWRKTYSGTICRRSATDTTLKQLEIERRSLPRGSFFR